MISLFLFIFEKVTLLTAVKLWAYQKKLPCSHLATRGNLGVSPAEQKCQKSSTFPTQIQKQHHAAIPLQAIKIHSDFICGQKMQEKPLQLDPRLCGPVAIPLVSDCDRHREAAAARESTALLGTEASKKPKPPQFTTSSCTPAFHTARKTLFRSSRGFCWASRMF